MPLHKLLAKQMTALLLIGLVNCPRALADGPPPRSTAPSQIRPDQDMEDTGDFIPKGAYPFKETFLDLESQVPQELSTPRILVRISEASGKRWLLPIYVITDFALPRASGDNQQVTLALTDVLYDPDLQDAIQKSMDKRFPKDTWEKATPIGNRAEVTLWLRDEDRLLPLATARFLRASGQRTISIPLALDTSARERLSKADPSLLGLTFAETYRGSFTQASLTGTLAVSSTVAVSFHDLLDTTRTGERATLLVAIGGGVQQKLAAQQYFGRRVSLEVLTREGSELNQTYVDNLVAKLFAGMQDTVQLDKQKDDTVVTFLFANGLKATASIGTFKGIKDDLKKQADRLTETANALSTHDRTKRDIETSAKGGILGIGAEASVNVRWEDEHDVASSHSQKLETRDMLEMAKALEGELPVAVLNAKQLQTLASRAETQMTVNLGTFREGRRTLVFQTSLASLMDSRTAKPTRAEIYASLIAKRKEVISSRAQKQIELDKELDRSKHLSQVIAESEKAVVAEYDKLEPTLATSGYHNGFLDAYRHIRAVWGMVPPDPNEIPSRQRYVKEWAEKYTDAKGQSKLASISGMNTIKKSIAELVGVDAAIDGCRRCIAALDEQEETLTKEIGRYLDTKE